MMIASNVLKAFRTGVANKSEGDIAEHVFVLETIATSISPPSFLMIGERPVCVWCRTANARFSHMLLSQSSLALNGRDAVCGGTLLMSGVPSACRKVLGGRRTAGLAATASVAPLAGSVGSEHDCQRWVQ